MGSSDHIRARAEAQFKKPEAASQHDEAVKVEREREAQVVEDRTARLRARRLAQEAAERGAKKQ